jgi:putative PIN family toxin of toxin-antitoxin system
MRVVLDTNVLLVSIAVSSRYRPIFEALLNGRFTLVISNDILTEYEEVIIRKTNVLIASNILEAISNLSNVLKQEIYIKWDIIEKDRDDNKFVDAAIAGNCNYLVSNDRHFNILKQRGNELVKLINIQEFLEIIETMDVIK